MQRIAGMGRNSRQRVDCGAGLVQIRGAPAAKQRFDKNTCSRAQIKRCPSLELLGNNASPSFDRTAEVSAPQHGSGELRIDDRNYGETESI
ncbi:MAG TPA: hypothetical protein VFK56_11785, partial [Mycobacterium sp.]|nr:hypothetical protein [Mycobacterium sp.]